MHTFHLNVNTIDRAKEFVEAVGHQNFDVLVSVPQHNINVDGGSILGLLSLPLTAGIDVTVDDYTHETLLRSALPNCS